MRLAAEYRRPKSFKFQDLRSQFVGPNDIFIARSEPLAPWGVPDCAPDTQTTKVALGFPRFAANRSHADSRTDAGPAAPGRTLSARTLARASREFGSNPRCLRGTHGGVDAPCHPGTGVQPPSRTGQKRAGLRGRSALTWRGRLKLLRWELLPSPAYLDWAYGHPPRLTLPGIYLARPVSALTERIKWCLIRSLRRDR